MIENISLVLTTIAALSAAIAAWFSYSVSKNSLEFQKTYARNQHLLNELNSTINEAITLRRIMLTNPLETSDETHDSIEPLLNSLKSKIQHLDAVDVIDFQVLKLSSVNSVFDLVRENNSLTEVIDELESKANEIFK